MQKNSFTFLLLLLSVFSFAQKNDTLQKKWNVGFQVNSIERSTPSEKQVTDSYSFYGWSDDLLFLNHESVHAIIKNNSSSMDLIAQRQIKCDLFLRFKIGYTQIDIIHKPEEYLDASGNYNNNFNSWKRRNDLLFSAGFGKNFQYKNFVFFSGLELPFYYYGKTTVYYFTQSNFISTGSPNASEEFHGSVSASYGFGVGSFAGFLFKYKGFGLGANISCAFTYVERKIETRQKITNINYLVSNGTTSSTIINDFYIANINMRPPMCSIIFSYEF